MRGLYIGRFQPYHLGHQAVINKISKEVDEIIIVIGSAQYSHTQENPFTAGERLEMIYESLGNLKNRCFLIPIEDVQRNGIWVYHLISLVPRFDVVYSNNSLVVQLFSEANIEVRNPPIYQREVYSGTIIRKFMLEGGNWKSLVPESVANVIENINGVRRLANINLKMTTISL